LMSDAFGGAVAVRDAFGEQVPDDDEQTVGDDDNAIVGEFAVGGFLEVALSEGSPRGWLRTARQATSTTAQRRSLRPSLVMGLGRSLTPLWWTPGARPA